MPKSFSVAMVLVVVIVVVVVVVGIVVDELNSTGVSPVISSESVF